MKNEVNRALVVKKKFCKSSLTLLAGFLLTFAFPSQGWSGKTTYYSKLTATAVGSGTVYVSKSTTKGSSASDKQNSSAYSEPTHDYYVWAGAASGWTFKGWTGTSVTFDDATKASGAKASVTANSTKESSPASYTATATFVPVFQFKAKADFATSSTGSGEVAVSFSTGSPDYKTNAVEATDSQNGAEPTTANATKTANFKAQSHTGAEFRGWYSDAAGKVKVSDEKAYSQSITSTSIDAGLSPQVTLYAKFEKVAVDPTWELYGVVGTSKTLEIGETIVLTTNTAGNTYSFGMPTYEDAGETNPVMNYDPATKTFTANRAGTVTVRFTQAAGEVGGVLWKAGEETFTFTVEKRTPEFAWADPLPHFTVGTTLPASDLFSFSPAECEQNWTLTSDNPTNLPSIAAGAEGIFMPKEVTGVTLTFHQPATWEWKEIANTSIKINVTKEPVVFNWKNPSLIAGNTYSWTDFVETNSEGAWNLVSNDESVIPTMRSIANTNVRVEAGMVTLSFTQGQDLGHDAVSIQTKTFTVYPNNGIATYSVNGNTYTDLQSAINASVVGSKKYNIIVASDGIVLPGNYTIPGGVTLVVPYESTGTKGITDPTVVANVTYGIVPYRTLTLVDGVNITLEGALAVTAELQSGDASKNPTGFPCRNTGILDMSKGGHIDVGNGGIIYAWGFIRGQGYLDGNNTQNVGTITAKDGAIIKECYALGDWGGGSFAFAAGQNSKEYRIYPFQSYLVQNIEVPLRMEYGSKDLLYMNVYANSSTNAVKDIKFIGKDTGVLFKVNSTEGAVTKWYDPTTDHLVVELEGDASLDNLQIKLQVKILFTITININAQEFDLPILSNMHIKLKNCNLNLSAPIVLQAGSIFEVSRGSSLKLSSNMFVYDHDNWGKFVNKKYIWPLPTIPTPKFFRGDGMTNNLEDAKLIVDGTLTIASEGALYTTSAGGDVIGNGGGQIVWERTLPSKGNIYGYTNGNGVKGSSTSSELDPDFITNNPCDPAKLHNDNDSYTASLSNGTFKNIHGRWFKSADAVELADHTYKFTYIDGDNTAATTFCVYASDKTGLTAGYKWVNVVLDNDFCGGKTFRGEDGNYYYYDNASTDAVTKWVQLVKVSEMLYSGSDNNLYTFTDGCAWASVGEIDDECMYTIEDVKMALVGAEFVAIEKDEYDEVYVKTTDHSDYYMLFDGCVWQHATKIPDTYKAYEVLGNPYIWLNDEWTEVVAEGAYFYTTDDQGLKHYYEFDNVTFAWVPVKNKVRVSGEGSGDFDREFRAFDDALQYASQYTNPTVTLLADATGDKSILSLAPNGGSTTYTIDLNGHTATMTAGSAEYAINIYTSATVTIMDNSDKQNGELHIIGSYNGQFKGIKLTKGELVLESGKVYVENTLVYASDADHKNAAAAAISLVAGNKAWVTINGGEAFAEATRNAYAIYAASDAVTNNAGNNKITINGGTLTAIAPNYAYGIYSYGIVSVYGGTINAKTMAVGTIAAGSNAYGIYLNVSSSAIDANSYRATLTMSDGTINANSATSTAHAIYANAAVSAIANGKKSDGSSDTAYKSTDGSESNKAAAHVDIIGGNLNATCGTSTTASGITVVGCYNSYTDKSEANQKPHTIKNVKIRTSANGTAYGILVTTTSFADLTGGVAYGNAVIDNVDAYAETTGSTNAYGLYVNATALWMNRAKYYNISAANRKLWYVEANANDGDLTHEAITQTGTKCYKYHIGNHVQGAKAVVNSGTFYAKCATTGAYGLYVNTAASSGDNSRAYPEVTINGGSFTGESQTTSAYGIMNYGHTTINAGTFNGVAATTDAYGTQCPAGTLTLKGGTYNATSNGSNSYGIAAHGTIDGTYGYHAHGTVDMYDGVVVNARSTAGGAVYGIYCMATSKEMTPALYDVSSVDKTQIFCLNEDGTIYKNATAKTTNDSKPKNLLAYRCGTHLEGGTINVHGGTINSIAYTSTAAGVGANISNVVRTSEVGHFGTAYGTVNVNGGTFNVTTETSSAAMGVRSYGIVNIEGGTFNMTSKTTNAEGVRVYFGTTTVNGGTFNINATTNTAYGVYTMPDYDTNYGYAYSGEIIVNGGTFNVKTYGGDTSYGAYSSGGTKNMKGAKVTGDVAKDYAVAGSITINGGNFTMTPSTGKNAYGMVVAAPSVLNSAKAYSRGTINGGFFKMVATTNACATGANATEDEEGVPQLQVKGGHFSSKSNLETTAPNNYVRDPYKVIDCIHPDYKTDYPFEVAEVCTITFKDDEDNTLWSGKQPKGTVAIYPLTNGVPEKAATADNSFEFISWDTPLTEITEDATYTASFNAVAKKYMVTWQDETGKEIDHMEWASGQTPTHDDPIKTGYTFTGWTPEISAVAGANQTYKATFSINSYTIIWLDEDGSEIMRETKQYGSTLTAPKPTKEGYSFKVWTPGVEKVTGDQTYQASYLLNVAEVTNASTGKTTPYTTWADALKAANKLTAGGTLKVLDDIKGLGAQTFSQTFTLDLNGHMLASATTKFITLNTAGKTLTIDDSQGGGRIEMIANLDGEAYAVFINNGTVVLNNGTIHGENVHATAADARKGIGVRIETANGKFVMYGGRVEGQSKQIGTGIYAVGPVEVYGGEITGTARSKARAIYSKSANLIVKNAYLEATTTTSTGAYGIYSDTNDKAPALTIDNVTINATSATTDAYGLNLYSGNKGTISNVKIQATTAPIDADATAANVSITSGFFDKETNLAKYIGTKKVVALVDEPEKAEGYNYKIVDAAYQVTFKAEDGTVLQQTNVEKDLQPIYVGEAQTKPSTPKYAYDFDGWMDASNSQVYTEAELPVVSKDVVYTAHFVQRAVEYPITFTNIDGRGNDYVQMVAYGEVPVYNGPTPYMSGAVSNYAYTFIGWNPELIAVDGPASYSPRFDLVISHNVSFVINNASATTPTTLTVAEGAAVECPADQLVDCQHIVGWYKDVTLNEEWNFASDKLGEEDLILYAKWGIKTYTITWLDEFGDEIDQTIVDCGVVPSHANLYKPSTASYSYEWKGWNKKIVAANADATYRSLGFNQVAKRYAIIFNTNGGSVIDPIEQEVGTPVVAPADPTREGYTFAGWDKEIPATMPAEDMTITANWTINQYTITFDTKGGSEVASITQDYNTAITAPANPTREGYTFAGWDKEIPATMPAEDMTITANWTINQYTITFDTKGGSEVASITQDYNTAITAPANPTREGYTFAGWDKEIPATMPAEDMTITANWTINQYDITWKNADGTTLTTTKVNYNETPSYNGATPTKAEDAQYTYTFNGWTPAIAVVSADATYTATYTQTKKKYTLTWELDGGEVTTAGTDAGSVEWGTSLTAPIVEKKGYTFASWSPEVPTTMPAADATYTAQWQAQKEVTYTVNHYYESALGVKEDTPFRTDEGHGLIGEQVSADDVLKLEGYDSPAPSTETITEGLVVEYYYKSRNLNIANEVVIAGADLDQIVVENAGTLSASTPSTTKRLVLTATPGNNDGANADLTNITISESVCIEIEMNSTGTMDDKLFYCFSVPFNVNVSGGVTRLNKNNGQWESAALNTNYRVYTYSESDRAAKGPQDSNWTPFNDSQFVPGVFYLCEFDNSNYNRYRFYAANKSQLDNKGSITVFKSSDNEDAGWNGVANNGLTDNKLSGDDDDDFTIIQILNSVSNSFESATASETPMAIGNAAMVQVNATGSVVVGETSSAVAARRMGEAASTEFINVRLYKENQDQHVDQIFIRASEDASEQYVAGIDLSKATMGTPKVARMWVNDYDLQLVANEALMTNGQAIFSLGMSAPANGEYTIALDETPADAIVYLTMNGSAIWNLNIAPAPISLSKGTEDSYGLRLVRKINNVVTGLDEAVLNGNVQKVILNDHLYIIRDGKVYSAHGHVIK